MIMLAMEIAKQLIIAAIVLFFLLKVLRPYLKSLMHDPALEEKQRALLADNTAADADEQSVQFAADGTPLLDQKATEEEVRKRQLEENIQKIRSMAREEPAIVANVVKEWVNNG
jgi:flagellar M-ring protein FliF